VSAREVLRLPGLSDIDAARGRLQGLAVRTPLIKLVDPRPQAPGPRPEIYLKLENLQPIGSFKLRGAGNAMRRMAAAALHDGVCTASAGNMAQGVAWCARELGIPCRVIVPEKAPAAKLDAVKALGAEVIPVPFADWWRVMETHDTRGVPGAFIHPVENNDVMAGHGTIAREIIQDLPDVDAVIVPFGGGGFISGIGAGMAALKPGVRILAAEVETAAPLRASLDANEPRAINRSASCASSRVRCCRTFARIIVPSTRDLVPVRRVSGLPLHSLYPLTKESCARNTPDRWALVGTRRAGVLIAVVSRPR
jgi:threonine dehydratase